MCSRPWSHRLLLVAALLSQLLVCAVGPWFVLCHETDGRVSVEWGADGCCPPSSLAADADPGPCAPEGCAGCSRADLRDADDCAGCSDQDLDAPLQTTRKAERLGVAAPLCAGPVLGFGRRLALERSAPARAAEPAPAALRLLRTVILRS